MLLSEAVRKRIIKLAKERKITLHKLAILSGIAHSTLNSFMNGKSNSPKLATLLHICEGFDMELKEFFDDTMFRNVEED